MERCTHRRITAGHLLGGAIPNTLLLETTSFVTADASVGGLPLESLTFGPLSVRLDFCIVNVLFCVAPPFPYP